MPLLWRDIYIYNFLDFNVKYLYILSVSSQWRGIWLFYHHMSFKACLRYFIFKTIWQIRKVKDILLVQIKKYLWHPSPSGFLFFFIDPFLKISMDICIRENTSEFLKEITPMLNTSIKIKKKNSHEYDPKKRGNH